MFKAIAAILIVIGSFFSYCSSTAENPVTGEKQRVGLTYEQEVDLGQRALPKLIARHGGLVPNPGAQALVDEVGGEIVEAIPTELPYQFDFHLLDDDEIVNAFALPGGQICITEAMFEQLKSKDQLAAILAHETAHVVSRHSAEQIAKQQLRQGLTGAAVIATYDPQNVEDRARMATLLGELASMKFSREDESEADILGLELLSRAEYPPESMLDVMEILEKNRRGGYPEFMSTHPSPVNRAKKIRRAIEELSQRQNS